MRPARQLETKEEVRWTKEILKRIIIDGDAKMLNEFCYQLGKYYTEHNLSTSQIRNILNEIQNMENFDEMRLQLIRPKIAYTAGRHLKRVPVIKNHLQPMLDEAIQMVDRNHFENFKNFVEAIVAYHRFHGGKE